MNIKQISFTRNVALPLVFGLTAIAVSPAAGAAAPKLDGVNFIQGLADVDQNGIIDANDDLANVLLLCDVTMPVRADIEDGEFDINEDGLTDNNDDLTDCDLNDKQNVNGVDIPTRNRVNVKNATIDVDQDGIINEINQDELQRVQLYVPGF